MGNVRDNFMTTSLVMLSWIVQLLTPSHLRSQGRVRRPLNKWEKSSNEIFVRKNQSFHALRRRVDKMYVCRTDIMQAESVCSLEAEGSVCLHASGAAILRTIDMAHEVKVRRGCEELTTLLRKIRRLSASELSMFLNTSTEVATDDVSGEGENVSKGCVGGSCAVSYRIAGKQQG
eukprot:763632-Hanusia_phi.AAC.2